jgi:MFS family permease
VIFNRRTPDYVAQIIRALNFSNPCAEGLSLLNETEWQQALRFADRNHLTLPLALRCGEKLPRAIANRLSSNLAANSERLTRTEHEYTEIAGALGEAGVEWVVLKGFSHWPGTGMATRSRPQYDIDLYCPPDHIPAAKNAISGLGYRSLAGFEHVALDHVPTMVRPSNWKWREDFFDVEIPTSVDLHYRLWDKGTERIDAGDTGQFWSRRKWSGRPDFSFPSLAPADLPAYASLHLLRHLLRGDLRPFHVYDIAWFLHSHANDDDLWRDWQELHDPALSRIQLVVFRLASEWFGCKLPTAVEARMAEQPGPVRRWFDLYSAAPLEAQFHPNKRELWLHLSLLENPRDRRAVFLRRVLPARLPPPAEAQVDAERLRPTRYVRKFIGRAVYHTKTLVPACLEGVDWWWRSKGFEPAFLTYWGAASLYNLGLFIFFLLYNVYLARVGYKEDFIGLATSLMTAGALAGSLPAGAIIGKLGVRRALILCTLAVPLACALRAVPGNTAALLITAFVGGFVSSLWAVIQAPAVAQLTPPDSRPFAFSLIFSSGISIGFFGGLLGGRLPQWFSRNGAALPSASDLRVALFLGCLVSLLAVIPAAGMQLRDRIEPDAKADIPLRSLWRFLVPAAIWNLAIGSVNPFISLYFTRHLSMPLQEFGSLFGGAKVLSLAAMLIAAAYFRRTGIVQGVARTQMAAAIAMAALAFSPMLWFAVPAYLAFESFEWMAEPGCYGLMTNFVSPDQRTTAAALYFLVASSAHVVSSALAGAAIARYGYPPAILGAAGVAFIAALAFQSLLRATGKVPATPALARSRS